MMTGKVNRAVCLFDPAIATRLGADDMVKYSQTRDFAMVEKVINKADPPTIYHYRSLTRSIKHRFVDIETTEEGKSIAAFRFGLVRVEYMRREDGTRVAAWKPTAKLNGPDGEMPALSEEELDLFYDCEIQEIGRLIYEASFLPPWLARAYRVPRTSSELWIRVVQSADASQKDASPNSAPPSGTAPEPPPCTPTAPEASAKPSEPATAAPATESTG